MCIVSCVGTVSCNDKVQNLLKQMHKLQKWVTHIQSELKQEPLEFVQFIVNS